MAKLKNTSVLVFMATCFQISDINHLISMESIDLIVISLIFYKFLNSAEITARIASWIDHVVLWFHRCCKIHMYS